MTVRWFIVNPKDPRAPTLAELEAGQEITHMLAPPVQFGICQRCGRPLMAGQPYMPRIPMRTSHRGFDHQHCPPHLLRSAE